MKIRKTIILLSLLLLLSCGVYLSLTYYHAYQKAAKQKILWEKRKAGWTALKQILAEQITKFQGETGILIKDIDANWVMSFNKEKLFPSASLAKIPLMASCFRAAEEKKLTLDCCVKLKSTDKLSGSGMLKDMPAGKEFKIKELIGYMIYNSDNTAANILTNIVGMDYLNDSFRTFGLKNTNLSRKIADFQSRNMGVENYTTAEDMALILEEMYRRNLINNTISEKCLELMKLQRINNRIPKYLPPGITVAHKTGLERSICHDVGIVFTDKGNFIICVLTKHTGINSKPAKEFIAKIALLTYEYFKLL